MLRQNTDDRIGQARYMGVAALVGMGTGLLGTIFHLVIDYLIHWPQWLAAVVQGPSLVLAAALITMVLTVCSVFVVRRFAPEAGGSGVPEIEGAMEGLRFVHWRRVLPVKFFAGIAAISSGLVLGREGPTIHIGASVAAGLSEAFKSNDLERRGLLAAGAAGGLACAFNAPLAAVLFVIEETHRQFPYTFRTYMGVIVAACVAAIVTEMMAGVGPDLEIAVAQVPLWIFPGFLLLGGLMGVLGVALNAGLMRMVEFGAECQANMPYVYPAIVGFLIGAVFILLPQAASGGEAVIMALSTQHTGIFALLLLATIRYLTTVTSYSTGVPGGIFAPILTLAVCCGLAFGTTLDALFPGIGVVPTAFGIAAMGGLFTASVRAPIVGVALTLELTGSYTLLLPVLITCGTANLIAQWLGGRPIYEQLLDRTLQQAGIDPNAAASREPVGLG
ncbi:CIC family chloride channel protein [Rhodoligotrophos appendicifer]|uniref:H(+)/Cl(-) exchange transporter ClcA n=1 Tax=Rhodoligotrophos appendicifer TaxID=987056 RepID=UPI001FE3F7CA|nr:H(+)/Cl(-) exchange transporter ClcA [Rhodoligotrophos appendicifer]